MTSLLPKLAAVAMAAVVAAALSPSGAAAQEVSLASRMGGKCMDAEGQGTRAGTRIIGYACSGAWNQKFTIANDGTIRFGSRCLDASGGQGKDGDQIVVWDCNGGANQKWRFVNGQIVGINGKCMDLSGGRGHWLGNQPVILWGCSGAENQGWYKGVVVAQSRVQGSFVAVGTGQLGTLKPTTPSGVIATGGGNVIATGGGNVIATGGGNVISTGGGNVMVLVP